MGTHLLIIESSYKQFVSQLINLKMLVATITEILIVLDKIK